MLGTEFADLQVTIMSASGLRTKDPSFEPSVPYAPYVLLRIDSKAATLFETDPIFEDTCFPRWDHQQEIQNYTVGDPLTFVIMDKGRERGTQYRGGVVGTCTLDSAQFFPNDFDGVLPLKSVEGFSDAQLRVKIMVLRDQSYALPGYAHMSQMGMPEFDTLGPPLHLRDAPTSLHIEIQAAEGLRHADGVFFGKSDPYCICEIPNKPHTRFQTKHINNTCNPRWNHAHTIGYVRGDPLLFTVMDKDLPPKHDDLLGKALLQSDQFYPHGVQGEIPLSEAGRGVNAKLFVKIEVVNDAPGGLVDFLGEREFRNERELFQQPSPHPDLLSGGTVVSERVTTREELIASKNLREAPPGYRSQPSAPPSLPAPPPEVSPSPGGSSHHRMFEALQAMMPDIGQGSR